MAQGEHEAEVGLDWTQTQETVIQHHETGPYMEPSGEKEERQAEKQLEKRHICRDTESGDDMEGGREGYPEPSQMEECHRWPMLNHGRRS